MDERHCRWVQRVKFARSRKAASGSPSLNRGGIRGRCPRTAPRSLRKGPTAQHIQYTVFRAPHASASKMSACKGYSDPSPSDVSTKHSHIAFYNDHDHDRVSVVVAHNSRGQTKPTSLS